MLGKASRASAILVTAFSSLKLAFSFLAENEKELETPLLKLCNVKLAQKRFLRDMTLKNKLTTYMSRPESVNQTSNKRCSFVAIL